MAAPEGMSVVGVLVTVGIFLLVQTGGGIWWAATINANVKNAGVLLAAAINELRLLSSTTMLKSDAEQRLRDMDQRVAGLDKELQHRIDVLDERLRAKGM